MGMLKQGKIHYSGPLFGDFWDFLRRKRVPDGKYGKNYLLNILYTHQARQLWFSEVFPEVRSLGDSQFG
jgi:hypothetical protein